MKFSGHSSNLMQSEYGPNSTDDVQESYTSNLKELSSNMNALNDNDDGDDPPHSYFPKFVHLKHLKGKYANIHDEDDGKTSEIPGPKQNTSQQSSPLKHRIGVNFRKDSTLMDDTYANINNIRLSIGARIRKVIYKIEDILGPIVKRIIPNFIIAHYVYILLWIVLGSIVIYPEKNMEYIDVLLFTAGASTQGGLASVQMNEMKLYQQIVLYVVCMFTTPIFIHSTLTFIRLYWYEKRFDDIQEKSIQQYKMNRTKTIANLRSATRVKTMASQGGHPNSNSDRNYDSHNASEGLTSRMQRFEHNLKQTGDQLLNNNEQENQTQPTKSKENEPINSSVRKSKNRSNDAIGIVDHLSEPSDSDGSNDNAITDVSDSSDGLYSDTEFTKDKSNENKSLPNLIIENNNYAGKNDTFDSPTENTPSNIKFGELPKPIKKKRDVAPRDLYMSISVLQQGPNKNNEEIESGPALHIKSPHELEEDKKRKLPTIKRHRKLLKERKLLKKKEQILKRQLAEGKTKQSNPTFNINIQNKKSRSLSAPLYCVADDENNDEVDKENANNNGENADENSLDPISTNDRLINEKLKKIQRSHTMHMPEFSKKILSAFDDGPNNDDNYDTESDGEPDDIHKKFKTPRRPSFFGRSLTGISKRRTMTNVSDLTDDEFLENYPVRVETNYLSWNPTVGRNSKFLALSGDQKTELGGVEYQSMKLLSKILICYYVGFHVLGCVFLIPFILKKKNYKQQLRDEAVSPLWWAIFTSMSSFNDLGYSLNSDSMMMFAQNAYVLIISGFFIVIGNTGFPIFLRLIIWIMRLFVKPLTMTHQSLSFLLDHPRRCFTLLFPSGPTWWLTAVLILLNATDWILFLILDFGRKGLSYLPRGYQVLAGLYQAISTRTAGFNVVDLAILNPAIQVSYMVMMYISVLPLAISIRRTNVYEEQSLGVYERDEGDCNAVEGKPKLKYIGAHLRKQLSFDLWFVFLAIFIICICEAGKIQSGDIRFGIFQIMFEVVSAYGTVGLSLGYPGYNTSFSGQFTKLSKLVIIATLIRGRHRGLPNSIDRAIMLSDEKLNLRDDLEAYHAMRKTNTMATDVDELFPSISRAATGVSRYDTTHSFKREPTIAENFKKGIIPWADIANKTGSFLGHVAANVLTVSGTPADKYSRQLTQYSTYDGGQYPRSRSTTYSGYNSNRRNSRFRTPMYDDYDYDDEEEDDEDDVHGRSDHAENIPLVSYSNSESRSGDRTMHANFIDRLNNINTEEQNKNLQEGSSGSEPNSTTTSTGAEKTSYGEDCY